jgi:hypothetical protein
MPRSFASLRMTGGEVRLRMTGREEERMTGGKKERLGR